MLKQNEQPNKFFPRFIIYLFFLFTWMSWNTAWGILGLHFPHFVHLVVYVKENHHFLRIQDVSKKFTFWAILYTQLFLKLILFFKIICVARWHPLIVILSFLSSGSLWSHVVPSIIPTDLGSLLLLFLRLSLLIGFILSLKVNECFEVIIIISKLEDFFEVCDCFACGITSKS